MNILRICWAHAKNMLTICCEHAELMLLTCQPYAKNMLNTFLASIYNMLTIFNAYMIHIAMLPIGGKAEEICGSQSYRSLWPAAKNWVARRQCSISFKRVFQMSHKNFMLFMKKKSRIEMQRKFQKLCHTYVYIWGNILSNMSRSGYVCYCIPRALLLCSMPSFFTLSILLING